MRKDIEVLNVTIANTKNETNQVNQNYGIESQKLRNEINRLEAENDGLKRNLQ